MADGNEAKKTTKIKSIEDLPLDEQEKINNWIDAKTAQQIKNFPPKRTSPPSPMSTPPSSPESKDEDAKSTDSNDSLTSYEPKPMSDPKDEEFKNFDESSSNNSQDERDAEFEKAKKQEEKPN